MKEGDRVAFRGRRPGRTGVEVMTGTIADLWLGPVRDGRRMIARVKNDYGSWEKEVRDLRPADAVTRLGDVVREP